MIRVQHDAVAVSSVILLSIYQATCVFCVGKSLSHCSFTLRMYRKFGLMGPFFIAFSTQFLAFGAYGPPSSWQHVRACAPDPYLDVYECQMHHTVSVDVELARGLHHDVDGHGRAHPDCCAQSVRARGVRPNYTQKFSSSQSSL